MISALKRIFAPSPLKMQAHQAYVQIVAQSRSSVFYRDRQVEDTLDGRFDVIVLHLALVILRCEEEATRADRQAFLRYLQEAFFADMDRSLREMGVGDTGVGRRVKAMAQAFYGRLKSYREAIDDSALLTRAIHRNLYRERAGTEESAAQLAAYAGRNRQALRLQSVDALMQGNIPFSS